MNRRLPPFAALRAFEATARLGKQSTAANELLVSTSAISHQIRSLEAFLGLTLFRRHTGGLTLTEEGAAYQNEISAALDLIESATKASRRAADDTPLQLHMFQSLANLWLIPNLRDLAEGLPDLRVSIISSPETVNLSGSDIDAAIVYRDKPPDTAFHTLLFEEVIIPVCSPDFLTQEGPFPSVEDVLFHRLIGSTLHRDEWSIWAAGRGVTTEPNSTSLSFDSRSNVLQAAREGLGLAMDRRPFGDWQKSRGVLVEPIKEPVATGWSYYFVTTERGDSLARVRSMRAWLLALVAKQVY